AGEPGKDDGHRVWAVSAVLGARAAFRCTPSSEANRLRTKLRVPVSPPSMEPHAMPLALDRAPARSRSAAAGAGRLAAAVTPFIDSAHGHATHELASLHAASLRIAALLGGGGDHAHDHETARYWLHYRTQLREVASLLGIAVASPLW